MSQAHHTDEPNETDPPSRLELDGRLDSIESWRSKVYQKQHWPVVQDLQSRVDDLEELVQEQAATIQSLTDQLETLSGLAEGQQSTPDLRNRDVYQSMLDRLVAKDQERYALTYREIEDVLVDKGHGRVWPAQLYDVIEELAELPGFSEGERRYNGEEQRAIRVKRSALPFDPAVNEINNDWGAIQEANGIDSEDDD